MAVMTREAQAVAAVDVKSVAPLDPHEKPTRLQEFVVAGTVTACLKGNLRPGYSVTYGLFAEGRPTIPPHAVVFLRHAKGHGAVWTAVDGPIMADSVGLRRSVAALSKGCAR